MNPTRLEWDGRTGLARHAGVQILLSQPPSNQWAEVHYTPGIQADVRERPGDARRDMLPHEIRAVQAWLANMAAKAREATGQPERAH